METLRYSNVTICVAPPTPLGLDLRDTFEYVANKCRGERLELHPCLGHLASVKYEPGSKKAFANQVSVGTTSGVHIKIFATGRVQLTGLDCPEESHLARIGRAVVRHLLNSRETFRVNITTIVADLKLGLKIDRSELYKSLKREWGPCCFFEPSQYPGVKIQYYHNNDAENQHGVCRCRPVPCRLLISAKQKSQRPCRKVTVVVFQTGSVLITGAQSQEQVVEAAGFVIEWIRRNFSVVHTT